MFRRFSRLPPGGWGWAGRDGNAQVSGPLRRQPWELQKPKQPLKKAAVTTTGDKATRERLPRTDR